MNRIHTALLGVAMILIGGFKLHATAKAAGELILPGCMGGDFLVQLDVPGMTYLHCWGCYVALAGLAVLGSAALRHQGIEAAATRP